jgi:hypothetical protein
VTTTHAGPWDQLLRLPPLRIEPRGESVEPPARAGTKLAGLLAELAARELRPTTLTLALCADLTPRQVWGLLKQPRAIGQVRFEGGRWSLVREFAGRDVERAAALLRDLGWRVERPSGNENV